VLLSITFAIIALVQIKDRGQRGKGLAIVALVISAVWVVVITAVVALAVFTSAERDDEGEITSEGSVSAFEVRAGDCFNNPPIDAQATSIEAVPCSQPHDAEAFATFDIRSEQYPGDNQVVRQAEAGCVVRFEDFIGLPYANSVYELVYLHPTRSSWRLGDDRTVLCAVVDPAGKITEETLRGARR
jgi:Septum formation